MNWGFLSILRFGLAAEGFGSQYQVVKWVKKMKVDN